MLNKGGCENHFFKICTKFYGKETEISRSAGKVRVRKTENTLKIRQLMEELEILKERKRVMRNSDILKSILSDVITCIILSCIKSTSSSPSSIIGLLTCYFNFTA